MNATAKPPLCTPLTGPLPFPESAPIEGYVIRKSKGRCGGDFHAAVVVNERTFCFLLGDGRGKGAIGTLQMLPLMTAFQLVVGESTPVPSYIMDRLAEVSRTCKVEATALCFVVSRIDNILWLTVSSAGHPPLILVSRSHQGRLEFPRPDSPAHGRMLHPALDCQMAQDRRELYSGDFIIAYTDGISDAGQERGRMFGFGGIVAAVESAANETPKEFAQAILKNAEECEEPLRD